MTRFARYFTLDAALAAGGTRLHDADLARLRTDWHGGRSFVAAMDYVRRGASPSELQPLRRVMDEVEVADRDDLHRAWVLAPVGALPDVPAFLAGHPANMRTQAFDPSQSEPHVVLLMVGVPNTVTPDAMAACAVRSAALAMRLAERHPVELWLAEAVRSDDGQDIGWAIRLDPTDTAHIVALCSAQGARILGLNLLARAGGRGAYPLQCGDGNLTTSPDRYAAAVIRAFGFPPATRVVLPQ